MASIKEGDTAPTFTLTDKDGASHNIGGKRSEYTVLYFYPKDDTPGCTIEAKEFSAYLKAFQARNARVFGISGGTDASKAKFCTKHGLSVPLLSDESFAVAQSYGAYGDKKFMGRSFKGIFRKTFVIDGVGKVVRVFDSVKPEGHAEEVLVALDELRGGAKRSAEKSSGAKRSTKKAGAVTKVATKKPATKRGATKKSASPKRSTITKGKATKSAPKKKTAAAIKSGPRATRGRTR
jgi:peroxiredoxin Q/BCP